jgi:uncharacterized protein
MFYNCHIHIFRDIDVPKKFLPFYLMRLLAVKPGFALIAKALHNINPFSDTDIFDRYAKFISIGSLGSQQKIFEECKRFYPSSTQFIVLPMDIEYICAGLVPRKYKDQLKELAELKKIYPQIIPFMHVDPRRKDVLGLLKKCVEEWGFKGVKLYPLLGYFPYDEDLYPIFEYCQQQNLPVISHCSPYNPVHFRGSNKKLHKLLEKSKTPINVNNYSRKELFAFFTDPNNYKYVLNDFKDLRICLAHWGSVGAWTEFIENPGNPNNWFLIIKDMLENYKTLYTDISFTLSNKEYFSLLKVLLSDKAINDKILFGSDYYMAETITGERRFGLDLRAFIGEDMFKLIAVDNPKVFLGLK